MREDGERRRRGGVGVKRGENRGESVEIDVEEGEWDEGMGVGHEMIGIRESGGGKRRRERGVGRKRKG